MENDESEMTMSNLLLFTSLLEDKDPTEKRNEIEDILRCGADVNAADADNNDDTPLHIAIRSKQIEIVKLFLQWDADVTRLNGDDKSALYIARGLGGVDGKEIKDMVEEYAKKKQVNQVTNNSASSSPPQQKSLASESSTKQKRVIHRADTIELSRYLKRDGTTGVGGQLYKTKSLSLVLLRASNDPDIVQQKFYLGTNIPGNGVFYDVCFKYNVKNFGKSIRLFMQCKHVPTEAFMTEADLRNAGGDWSLANCFDSFLKIKDKFSSDINDPIFGEDFNNVETNFNNVEEDIDFITREVQKRRITSLAQCFIDFIFSDKNNYSSMMEDKLIKTYHVALAQNVLQISNSAEKDYREAVFLPHFFQSNDIFLVLLKENLCQLTVKNHHNKSQFGSEELVNLFKQLPKVPSSEEISMFIGFLVTYDEKNNKLKLMSDLSEKGFSNSEIQELTESLEQIHVTASNIKEAVLKAGENKLSTIRFKVPLSFGNIEMALSKNHKVLDNIVAVFAYLFRYYRNTKIIEINETNVCQYIKSDGQVVTTEFLKNESGIGTAIGNLLVLDNFTNLLKFNTTTVLSEPANILLQRLKSVLPKYERIENYKLKIDFYTCPRISFTNTDYDKILARYFLGRLWFYTNQKNENRMDEDVKKEINKYYKTYKGPAAFGLCTHIDSIYSSFHDEIQKWWMVTPENTFAPYLTQESEIFRIAQEGVIDNPLLTLHHQMYLSKMKKTGIEFISDAVAKLQLEDSVHRLVNIKTKCALLTGIKIRQHYKDVSNYNFLDFNYMLSLPADDRNAIIHELKDTAVEILIVICGMSKSRKPVNESLHRIINSFNGKKVIVVTENDPSSTIILRMPHDHSSVQDEMNDLLHFNESSKEHFVKDTTLVFQGPEVNLNAILDETSLKFLDAKILLKLINNERIEIGHILTDRNYENVQDNYIARYLDKEDSKVYYPVNSLDDIEEKVVIIIAKHGMGKSTLLTHIALESKKAAPSRWIVRINLEEFSNYFYAWQRNRIEINKTEVLKFLCIASLKHTDDKTMFTLVERDEKIILESCGARDAKQLLELELFLHYYNESKITFLFYGFDYVCPPFGVEVIKMLKVIKADNVTMWVTSHLVRIPKKMLENHFGTSYTLKPIDATEQAGFFYKFWKTNLQMEKINSELFSTLWEFLEYMSGKHNLHEPGKKDRIIMPWISMPLHMLYLMAVEFFQTELCNFSFEHIKKKLKQHLDIDLNKGSKLGSYMDLTPEEEEAAELAGTPLYMYVAANYFECKIKGRFKIEPKIPEIKEKWDLWGDAVCLYEHFLHHNMKKLCSESNLDEDQEVDKRREFLQRHKKLALLAILKEEHLRKLLPADEINELKSMTARINSGEERSPLVDCVLDNVPRFFHIIYAEYCAVEYLTDIIKGIKIDSLDHLRHKYAWDFLVNMILFTCSNSVRTAFDYKLKNDTQLAEITSSDQCKNIILELLTKQNVEGACAVSTDGSSSLQAAVDSGMNNLVKLFLTSLDVKLTNENVKSFMKLFQTVDIALNMYNICGGNVPANVTDFFADMTLEKFVNVAKSEHTIELPLKVIETFANSNVVDGVRRALTRARERLVNRAADRFGLSQDNIELFRHLAERIRRYND
ncbi:hypothetical protein O3G_MSEX013330 [Manduca sexta]|uniref:Uncharacterized protein n=1 Tax=Manduca sexta TaxID=7130 RepID=A0A922CYB7_MANSE|nr:hypothetical protein O3G_MSEX013330 [Manduca sexta]KAG6462547.1 hypothetical protein O3G_MSEX013330 [Manduca sexta]